MFLVLKNVWRRTSTSTSCVSKPLPEIKRQSLWCQPETSCRRDMLNPSLLHKCHVAHFPVVTGTKRSHNLQVRPPTLFHNPFMYLMHVFVLIFLAFYASDVFSCSLMHCGIACSVRRLVGLVWEREASNAKHWTHKGKPSFYRIPSAMLEQRKVP